MNGPPAPDDLLQLRRQDGQARDAGYKPRADILFFGSGAAVGALCAALAAHRGDINCNPVAYAGADQAPRAVLRHPHAQACVFVPGAGDRGEAGTAAREVARLRPELGLFLVDDEGHGQTGFAGHFGADEGAGMAAAVHASIAARMRTPFFSALQAMRTRRVRHFHAPPVADGASVLQSPWLGDMVDYFGTGALQSQTSATSAGLDSLLAPVGSIRQAQHLAARAFGAQHTFFVTNGTSTANKIVVQALVQPGDIVLLDRNCHKSHHYAMVLAGSQVAYLDSYALHEHGIYGAVPLHEIKKRLIALRRAGQLHRVRMLILTNCTFDGIVYDPQRVMEECLAIKPDLIFLWDEAWFAFAGFHPAYRARTGMHAAAALGERLAQPQARERYAQFRARMQDAGEDEWETARLVPDPDAARVRAYVTQSTHKTLSALRQGSMIHVHDADFDAVAYAFNEAYMTHTSTSPNYLILASLDLARRQAELEGYALVERQRGLALALRQRAAGSAALCAAMRILAQEDLVPARYGGGTDPEFVLDPSRMTLDLRPAGVDGHRFRHEILMGRYGIQINKTSHNSVLLMTHIGSSSETTAYLFDSLLDYVRGLHADAADAAAAQGPARLPAFSAFHPRFSVAGGAGDLRGAFYLAAQPDHCRHLGLVQARRQLDQGEVLVAASFVVPYPPGTPVLVPGQIIDHEALDSIASQPSGEMHSFDTKHGLRVFSAAALATPI